MHTWFSWEMIWYFYNSGFNSGKFNMDFDLELAKNCVHNEFILRLYRWKPYCISLGANQSEDILNKEKIRRDDLQFVKRPTGGRAIFHAEELTYSIISPIDKNTSARKLYKEINSALIIGLSIYDSNLIETELETIQPDFKKHYESNKSSVCFSIPAKSELKYNKKKLVGSAQRKLGNAILQHGSILCGNLHKKIVDYLNINDDERFEILNTLQNKTIEIESILNEKVDYEKLILSIKTGFENYFNCKFKDLNTYEDIFEHKFLH